MRDTFWETTTPTAPHRQQSVTYPSPETGAYLLVHKLCPAGQASGLVLIWRAMEVHGGVLRTEVSGPNLCSPPITLLSLTALSQKGAYILVWHPGFTVGPLVARWVQNNCNQWRVLKQLPPPGSSRSKQTQELRLSGKEAYKIIFISAA